MKTLMKTSNMWPKSGKRKPHRYSKSCCAAPWDAQGGAFSYFWKIALTTDEKMQFFFLKMLKIILNRGNISIAALSKLLFFMSG